MMILIPSHKANAIVDRWYAAPRGAAAWTVFHWDEEPMSDDIRRATIALEQMNRTLFESLQSLEEMTVLVANQQWQIEALEAVIASQRDQIVCLQTSLVHLLAAQKEQG
jgi:hypothetical protein